MKNILKIELITIIIALAFIIVSHYIVNANTEEIKEFVYEETLEINNKQEVEIIQETNRGEETTRNIVQKFDLDDLVIKDKKYTTEYETSNGEKFTVIGSLKIPKINIEYDILSSTSVELLKLSLNRYWGANPNQVGNMCIVGHNYLDSRFFGRLHTLKNGDYIEITDSYGGTLKYYVYDMFIADPYDTRCTSQLTNGEKDITLITCYNRGTQRLVVKARAQKDETTIINKIIEILK